MIDWSQTKNTHKPHLWLEPIRALRFQTISLMTCRTYIVKPHIENQNPNNQNPQILKLVLKKKKINHKEEKKKKEKSRFSGHSRGREILTWGVGGWGWGLEGLSEMGLRMTVVRSDTKWAALFLSDCCLPIFQKHTKDGILQYNFQNIWYDDSWFCIPTFFFFNAKSTMLQLQSFLSLYVKEFQCLGKVELAGEERVYPK